MAAKKKTAKKSGGKRLTFAATAKLESVGVAPLGDRVLIRPITAEENQKTTAFGLIIPDTIEKEKSDRGVVVAVGKGKRNDKGEHTKMDISVGDKVLYTKPWHDPVKINGVEHYLISENEVLAILH